MSFAGVTHFLCTSAQSENFCSLKFAFKDTLLSTMIVRGLLVFPSLQFTNKYPTSGVTVNVTGVPFGRLVVLAGLVVTVPKGDSIKSEYLGSVLPDGVLDRLILFQLYPFQE